MASAYREGKTILERYTQQINAVYGQLVQTVRCFNQKGLHQLKSSVNYVMKTSMVESQLSVTRVL